MVMQKTAFKMCNNEVITWFYNYKIATNLYFDIEFRLSDSLAVSDPVCEGGGCGFESRILVS